jgi:hypothetical protein
VTTRIQTQRLRNGREQVYGELEVTTCPMDAYVDGVTGGDDDAHDGGLVLPYKMPMTALARVPRRIQHVRNIFIAPGTYGGTNAIGVFDFVFEGGQLNLIGTGGPVQLTYTDEEGDEQPAEYEIDTVEVDDDGRLEIVSTGGAPPDDTVCWVAFTSGAAAGLAFPAYSMRGLSALIVTIGPAATACGAAPGDEFELVVPSVTLRASELVISLRDHGPSLKAYPPLNLCNITLDLSDSYAQLPLILRGNGSEGGIGCTFARILLPPVEA